MLKYSDISSLKKAFVFELDDVLYPEKDYLLQVYYLFANFIEYTEGFPSSGDLTGFFKNSLEFHGQTGIFDRAQEAFGFDSKYKSNFELLHKTARLPLKLLIYDELVQLLQEIVIDRKKLFIITNGDPEQQLNKIRQTDWKGLEDYLTVFFANESKPKPDTSILKNIFDQHGILRKEILIIGKSETDEEFAVTAGIDYLEQSVFIS